MIGNDLVAQSPLSTVVSPQKMAPIQQQQQQQQPQNEVSPVTSNAVQPATGTMPSVPQSCDACQKIILDRFICYVMSRPYHPRCLACSDCGSQLVDRCFAKSSRLYCRSDFLKRFSARCGACSQSIAPDEMVRRARNRVYHLSCFACCVCHVPLATGDELYMADENRFLCRADFMNQNGGNGEAVNGPDMFSRMPSHPGLENGGVLPDFNSGPSGYMVANPEMGADAIMRLHHHSSGGDGAVFNPGSEMIPQSGGEINALIPPSTGSNGSTNARRRGGSKQKNTQAAVALSNSNNTIDSINTTSADWRSNSSEQSVGGNAQSKSKSSNISNSKVKTEASEILGSDTLDGDNNEVGTNFSDDESLPSSELIDEDLIDSEGESVDGEGSPSKRKGRRNKQPFEDSNAIESGVNRQSSSASGSGTPGAATTGKDGKRRGPRTTIKAKQLEMLKSAFAATPKPTRHIREQLAAETGLNMRVIQVWFQNRRSKERRMKQLSAMGARRVFLRNQRRSRPFAAPNDGQEMMQHPGTVGPGGPLAYYPDGAPPEFYAAYHQQHGAPPPGSVDPSMFYSQQPGVVMGEPVGPGFGMPPSSGPAGLASPPLSQAPSTGADFDQVSMHHSGNQAGFMLPMPGQDDMMFAS